jgi:succinyl-CoA synthetase beta subunit
VEVILSNPKVKAVLFNIFGGITRCDEVARGLIEAFAQINPQVPFVVRLDGTNDQEGRRLLAEANLPNVYTVTTMDGAARKVVQLASGAMTDGGRGPIASERGAGSPAEVTP